jgi:hypothetical protein
VMPRSKRKTVLVAKLLKPWSSSRVNRGAGSEAGSVMRGCQLHDGSGRGPETDTGLAGMNTRRFSERWYHRPARGGDLEDG